MAKKASDRKKDSAKDKKSKKGKRSQGKDVKAKNKQDKKSPPAEEKKKKKKKGKKKNRSGWEEREPLAPAAAVPVAPAAAPEIAAPVELPAVSEPTTARSERPAAVGEAVQEVTTSPPEAAGDVDAAAAQSEPASVEQTAAVAEAPATSVPAPPEPAGTLQAASAPEQPAAVEPTPAAPPPPPVEPAHAPPVPAPATPAAPSQVIHQDDRGIDIGRDAQGNAIITGDGNIVVVQNITQQTPPAAEEPPSAGAVDVGPSPYKGLVAFDENDADRFFGREEQVRRLWEMFRNLHEAAAAPDSPPRLLPLLGPSGSGKSSLARAGLIPELARRPLPGMKAARVAVLLPGSHPLEALAGVLARIATGDAAPVAKTREFAAELARANEAGQFDGLRRIADTLPDIGVSPLIVLVDQLEEIFTLCDDAQQREAFIGNLLQAVSDPACRVSAIVTLRTDFLAETQQHAELNEVIAEHGVIIPSMKEDELRRAITLPAERAGHPLDAATVDLLISETRDREGALPLLQFALQRIWDGMAAGVAPAETLKEIGGVGGALAREAQRIYEKLSDRDQRITRRVFLGLVQLGEGTRDTRRRTVITSLVAHGDNPRDVQAVIDRFASAGTRLITVSADAQGHETAEVTHEALFEHWRQLDEWLAESRDDLRFLRRLDQAARHWDGEGRAEGLLWRPPDLELLQEYHQRAGEDMTPLQVEFFTASREAEQARIAEKQRQQRERARLLKTIAGLSATAAAVAITLSVWAVIERGRAQALSEIAQENERQATANEKLAVASAAEAQRRFQQARETVDAMLTGAGEVLRRYPGTHEPRRFLLQRAAREYERFVAEETDDPDLRAEFGRTLIRLGNVHKALGGMDPAAEDGDGGGEPATLEQRMQPARDAYLKAEQLLQTLSQQHPQRTDFRRELANSRNARALLLVFLNDPDGAEPLYQAAIDDLSAIVKLEPDAVEPRVSLGGCLANRSNLRLHQGRDQEAQADLDEAVRHFQWLRDKHVENPDYQFQWAEARNNTALLLMDQGRHVEAVPILRESLAAYEKLIAARDPKYVDGQTATLNFLAHALEVLGQDQQASQEYQQAIESYDQLVKVSFELPVLEGLVAACINHGRLLHTMGDNAAAATVLERGAERFGMLQQRFTLSESNLMMMAELFVMRGRVFSELGLFEEAEADFENGLMILGQQGAAESRYRLAFARHARARLRRNQGRPQDALPDLETACRELMSLSQQHPGRPAYRDLYAWCLMDVGDLYFDAGDARSQQAYQRAVTLWRELAADGRPPYLNNLAWFLCHCHDPDFRNAEEALRAAEEAVRSQPQSPKYQHMLGVALYRRGDYEQSVEALEKAREQRGYEFGLDHFFLAMAQAGAGQAAAARQSYQDAAQWLAGHQPASAFLTRIRDETEAALGIPRTASEGPAAIPR